MRRNEPPHARRSERDDLDRLEHLLRSEVAAAAREETADDGSTAAARMARIERIAKLLEVASSPRLVPIRNRWPLVAVAATTLALLSVLLFTHLPRTEIELEVTVSQAGFDLSAIQPLTKTATLTMLGVSGLQQARAASLQAFDAPGTASKTQGVVPAAMAYVVTEASGGAITLAPLVFPANTRLWIRSSDEADALQLSWTSQSQTIQVDLSGSVKVSLGRELAQHYDLASPRPLLLDTARDTVDLDLRPTKRQQPVFESQLRTTALSFSHIDQSVDPDNTILRKVSTIKSGTLYLEGLGGQARALRDGELLEFDYSSGTIRSLRLTESGLFLSFRGIVSGMRTGWGNAQRNLMPSQLEWLMARHGLGLLWGATLYVLGILVSLMKWWGLRV